MGRPTKDKTVDAQKLPALTPLVFKASLHWMLSGIENQAEEFISIMRMLAELDRDPSDGGAETLVQAWDKLTPFKRRKVVIDDLCREAEVSPAEAFGWFAEGSFQMGLNMARVIAGVQMPALMVASMKKAQDINEGTEERRMHFQASGYLPMPRSGIAIQTNITSQKADVSEAEMPREGSFESNQRGIINVIRRDALPAAVEAESVEMPCTPAKSSTNA